MSLTDLLTAAMQHPEKETLAWMILHSLYQARIVNHANTGEHGNVCPLWLFSPTCLLDFEASLFADTGLALPQMDSALDG